MNLHLASRTDGRLELRLGRLFRLLLFFIALLMGGAAVSAIMQQESPDAGPIIFFLLALAASAYEERWIFGEEAAESRHGLIFLYRRRSIPAARIASFSISAFTKGRLSRTTEKSPFFMPTFAVLRLDTTDGEPVPIEILRIGKKKRLEAKAVRIAAACSKPFEDLS